MQNYLDLIDKILSTGIVTSTRNGDRLATFVHLLEYNLADGFPLLTLRGIPWKNVIHELIWFLNGETNIKYLNDNDVHIWDANADAAGECGPIYGFQWRGFNAAYQDTGSGAGVDQIVESIRLLRMKKHTTRNVVQAWNPAQQSAMQLPPCHVMFQLFTEGTYISLCAQMRSTDVILGLPTNIASYATLLHLYCALLDRKPGMLYMSLGDTHLYAGHVEKSRRLLDRQPLPLPSLTVNRVTPDLRDLLASDVTLHNYQHHKNLSFPLVA